MKELLLTIRVYCEPPYEVQGQDCKVLAKWENVPLTATVEGAEGGVVVKIYEQ